jgi:hypothetical protein
MTGIFADFRLQVAGFRFAEVENQKPETCNL